MGNVTKTPRTSRISARFIPGRLGHGHSLPGPWTRRPRPPTLRADVGEAVGALAEQFGDRAHLGQELVEHRLGGGVDADLGSGAVGLDLVDPLLQRRGPLLDPVDPPVELALGALGALFDVETGVLAQGVELAAGGLLVEARAAPLRAP